jgi:hypothetical protein
MRVGGHFRLSVATPVAHTGLFEGPYGPHMAGVRRRVRKDGTTAHQIR